MTTFADWIGRSRTVTDRLDAARCNALAVALGGEGTLQDGDPLPPLDHWLHFWDVQPPSAIGPDGHPEKGGFLPPIELPRRMWAGGRVRFLGPLALGEHVSRTTTIAAIEEKAGKSGTLVFVTLVHELSGSDGVAIREEQDLVYRAAAGGTVAAPEPIAAPECRWHETVMPDPVLLFRYSALTMNGHRIHYDLPYATGVEGYPGLVVHGPLQAAMLARAAAVRLGRPIAQFDFRGSSPAFADIPLHVCGDPDGDGGAFWTQQGPARAMVAQVATA